MDEQITGIEPRLMGIIKRLLDPSKGISDPFPVEAQLSDLGITSLKMVNLMLAIEAEFDVAIPELEITPENFHSLSSVGKLIERTLRLTPPD